MDGECYTIFGEKFISGVVGRRELLLLLYGEGRNRVCMNSVWFIS